jgi:hypothetical protein
MVGYVFSKALQAQKPVMPFELAARPGLRQPAEVGDESYWLSPAGFRAPVLATKERLTVGDRLTVGRDGHLRHAADRRARHLEVVGIVGAPLLEIVAASTSGLHLLVICRVVDPDEPESEELVQFVIALEKPAKPEALPQAQDPLGRT